MAKRKMPKWKRTLSKLLNLSGNSHSTWSGAKQGPTVSSWVFSPITNNEAIRSELATLRARSRDLARNNFLVAAFGRQFNDQVFGPKGLALQGRVQSRNGMELDETVNRVLEESWNDWANSPEVGGSSTLNELDALAGKCLWRDGEAIIRRWRGFEGNRFRYGISIIDPCTLDHELNDPGKKIYNGVEIDDSGPTFYHFKTSKGDHKTIPAEQIIHAFIKDEPGQTRGVPWMAPAMVTLKHLEGLMEAAVVNARSKALTMGFFKNRDTDDADDIEGDEDSGDGSTTWNMEAGVIRDIQNKEFQGFDPGFPDANFESFIKTAAKAITSAIPGSYASVTGDIENASWSALRNDEMLGRRSWECVIQLVIRTIRRIQYEDWLESALMARQIRLGEQRVFVPADFGRLNRVHWQGPIFPVADELKRQKANEVRLSLGTASKTMIAAEEGNDLNDIEAQIKKEGGPMEPKAPPAPFKPIAEEQAEEDAA